MIKHAITLAVLLALGLGKAHGADLDALRAKAAKGEAKAMVELAEAHYWGRGAELDWKQSLVWAEKGAAAEHPVATYRMGVQYLLGHGVGEDIAQGQQLINLSADGLEKRAKDGDHSAQFYLALMYHIGIGRMDNSVTSRQWMTLAAEGGQVEAQYYMGRIHAMGVGVERDPVAAKRWWLMSAERGHVPTWYNLGLVLLRSGNQAEHPEGLKWLKQAVAKKLDRAEFFMGEIALRGVSMPKDEEAAFKFFEQSAHQGYVRGQFLTGQALAKGVGVKVDPVAASVWLTLAARAGDRQAAISKKNLGNTLTSGQLLEARLRSGKFQVRPSQATRKSRAGLMSADPTFLITLGIEELKKRSAAGEQIAKVRLADLYLNGRTFAGQVVLRRNIVECLRLTKQLAKAGHIDGQWNLALFYLKGVFQRREDGTLEDILKKDSVEGGKWMHKAAAQDYTNAMVALGGLYEQGQGVPLDYKKAMEWFEKAAAQGDAPACHAIALAHLNGRGKVVPVDKPKAIQWLKRGADKGDPQSQYALGGVLLTGEGIKKDVAAARKWFLRAAWQNEPRAQLQLGRMLRDGLGGTKDLVRSAMWINLAVNNRVLDAMSDFNNLRDQLKREEKIRAMEMVRKFSPRIEIREVLNAAGDLTETKAAAEKGNKEAQYQLGLRHLNGTGVKRDQVQACKWLKLAALQNHALALKEYDELSLKMTNKEINAADKAVDKFLDKP